MRSCVLDTVDRARVTPSNLERFLNSEALKQARLRRATCFDRKTTVDEACTHLAKRHVSELVRLGAYDRAARFLLDTQATENHADYYRGCLKACVLSKCYFLIYFS